MKNKEVLRYRERLLAGIVSAADGFCAACRAVADPHDTQPGGWTVHQLAAHTRDVHLQVYGMRMRRTLAEDEPVFPNFDAEAWMAEHYDAAEPLDAILNQFKADVDDLAAVFSTLPPEAWSRLSRHETQGERTLQIWAERALAHIREHWDTVTKVG